MQRIRHSAAAVCYGCAWLSMVALIAMLAVAELIQGKARARGDWTDADAPARLYVVRRPRP